MTNHFAKSGTLSIEQLDEMARAVAKQADKLRDEGGVLTERLVFLNEQSEAAIANAKQIQEAISAVNSALAK